jgi:hypothetical protein
VDQPGDVRKVVDRENDEEQRDYKELHARVCLVVFQVSR